MALSCTLLDVLRQVAGVIPQPSSTELCEALITLGYIEELNWIRVNCQGTALPKFAETKKNSMAANGVTSICHKAICVVDAFVVDAVAQRS